MSALSVIAAGGASPLDYKERQTYYGRGSTGCHRRGWTHIADAHVAAALDTAGRLLAVASFSATHIGYGRLLRWLLRGWGELGCVGVEGTGSYGAGLARFLSAEGVEVKEVIRPRRQTRRGAKSDPADAEAAARAVLSGEASGLPKSADGAVEAIRMLRAARRSAVKARTCAINQLKALLVTAPEQVAAPLRGSRTAALMAACCGLRPGGGEAVAAAKMSMRCLARRHRALSAEISELDAEIARLCAKANPALIAARGVGADTAAALLIAAGDNPQRLRSEASFAALCGACPVEASSGRTVRHRLNRGGDRQANNALWRIATVRLRCDQQTKDYAARRRAEGKNDREIIRCLKRYIAREIYRLLTDPPVVPHGADLRQTTPTQRNDPRHRSRSPQRLAHSHLTPRTRPHTRPRPRRNVTNNTSPKSRLDKHRSIV